MEDVYNFVKAQFTAPGQTILNPALTESVRLALLDVQHLPNVLRRLKAEGWLQKGVFMNEATREMEYRLTRIG